LMQPVRVRIGDQEYLIKAKDHEDQALRIAEYVNEKLKEIEDNAQGLSEKKAVILAALNIAGDYFQLRKERDELLALIRQRTEALIYNIDSVMG
jgi:cell division protein ZapA